MREVVNLPELSRKMRKLAGWFRLQVGGTLTPEGKANCALACEQAADEIDARLAAPPNFSAAECTIHEEETTAGRDGVHLWHVHGVPGKWYPTKIVAEQVARITFPDEPNNAYGRVYYNVFVREEA